MSNKLRAQKDRHAAAVSGYLIARARDSLAGLVIFLLGVPLSIGAALASGAQAANGLMAAAVGGLVAGAVGGAPFMVTGPVVALATFTLSIIQRFGFPSMCAVTVLAGIMQLLFATLRFGRLMLTVHAAILEGILASVGVVLVLSQMHAICGTAPNASAWRNVVALPEALLHADPRDLVIAATTLSLVIIWNRSPGKRYVPSALLAIGLVTGLCAALELVGLRRVNMPGGGLAGTLPQFSDVLSHPQNFAMLVRAALELAMVCSIYSLLSAVSVDRLHSGPRARLDRELAGQGAANLLSGLLGGLPVSGAALRSTANIEAGATSQYAAVVQGGLMLLALTQLGFILRYVPVACLAAFFVMLGLSLIQPRRVLQLYRTQRLLLLYAVSLVGALSMNLMMGVVCGLAVNLIQLCSAALRFSISVEHQPQEWHVNLRGVASFVGIPRLLSALGEIPENNAVCIASQVTYMDDAASAALTGWREAYVRGGGRVRLQSREDAATPS